MRTFTGLKDINGVKIYEGDIIQCDDNISKVKSPEWFYCDAFDCFGYKFASGYFSDNYDKCEGSRFLKNVIVIGNIYDNPKLINSITDNGE
jgi:uncharacterized phage protein (TIGR01671 family)